MYIAFSQFNGDNYFIMNNLKPSKSLEHLATRYVWWETPDILRQVLKEVPPGYFNTRSRDFWHLKLKLESIPPLPKRSFL